MRKIESKTERVQELNKKARVAYGWFKENKHTIPEKFRLNKQVEVLDAKRFVQMLESDILDCKKENGGPRGMYGAVQEELIDLFELFGGENGKVR